MSVPNVWLASETELLSSQTHASARTSPSLNSHYCWLQNPVHSLRCFRKCSDPNVPLPRPSDTQAHARTHTSHHITSHHITWRCWRAGWRPTIPCSKRSCMIHPWASSSSSVRPPSLVGTDFHTGLLAASQVHHMLSHLTAFSKRHLFKNSYLTCSKNCQKYYININLNFLSQMTDQFLPPNANTSNKCHNGVRTFKIFVSFQPSGIRGFWSPKGWCSQNTEGTWIPQINTWQKATKDNCVGPSDETEIFLFY